MLPLLVLDLVATSVICHSSWWEMGVSKISE
jgi:hypothetical protein